MGPQITKLASINEERLGDNSEKPKPSEIMGILEASLN